VQELSSRAAARHSLAEVRDHASGSSASFERYARPQARAKTRPETDDVAELARVLPAKGFLRGVGRRGEHHARVLACVDGCPRKSATFAALAFEELTSVEIASVLGITESSVSRGSFGR